MDIRPTRSEQNAKVQQDIRKDLPATDDANKLHTNATRSRAPELTEYARQSSLSFREVRAELVEQAKQRLEKGDYTTRSVAIRTAAAILLSS